MTDLTDDELDALEAGEMIVTGSAFQMTRVPSDQLRSLIAELRQRREHSCALVAALQAERDAYRVALERIKNMSWRSSESLTDIASAVLAAYRQSHPEETR